MSLELTVYPVQAVRELQFRERPCIRWGRGMMGIVEKDNLASTHEHTCTDTVLTQTWTNMAFVHTHTK